MTRRRRYLLWWSLLLLACLALFLSLRTDVLGSSTAAGYEGPTANVFMDSSGPESGNGNLPGSSGPSNSEIPSQVSIEPTVTFAGSSTGDAPRCPSSAGCQGSIGGGNLPYGTIPQSGGSGPSASGGGQASQGEGSFAHNLLGFFTGWGGSSGSFGGGFGNSQAGGAAGTAGANPSGEPPSNSGGSQTGTPGSNAPPSDPPGDNPSGSPPTDPAIFPPDGPPSPPIITLTDLPAPTDSPPDGSPFDQGDPPGGGPNTLTDPPRFDPPSTNLVPEPGTLAIVAAGFAALARIRRRKTRRNDPARA